LPSLADYLKLAGGTMTGDLDLAANKLKFSNFVLKQTDIYTLGLWNRAETSYASLLVNGLYMYTFRGMDTNTPFQSKYGTANSSIDFKSWVGAGYVESAKVINGEFQISRAGEIYPAQTSTALGSAGLRWDAYFDNCIANKLYPKTYTDASRPSPIQALIIYNSDDNGLNIGDGINWRDTDGNIT